jgi:hypothetical protein
MRELHVIGRRAVVLGIAACVGLIARAAAAQDAELLTEEGVINGTMTIDFKTRTTPDRSGQFVEGSPAAGVQDTYAFDFNVAKTTQYTGKIMRQPTLYTKVIRSAKQKAAISYDTTLSVLNPRDLKQKRTVGKWVGKIPIDVTTGAYDLAGGKAEESGLRIAVDSIGSSPGFTDFFMGRLIGKAEKKVDLTTYTNKRLVGEKTIEVVVKKSDPMKFENMTLAKGPAEIYPRTVVNGRLDYDYETGNWFTDGIRMKYSFNGKDMEDVITGSIKWVEDPNRATNGKGQYEFNLRFNEDKNKSAKTEADAFKGLSDEEKFFAVDNSIPCLTGTVAYVDTMVAGSEAPSSSKVTYKLDANKLSKQQIVNFFKLWLVCIGPTNDE